MCPSSLGNGAVRCTVVHKTSFQNVIIDVLLSGGTVTFLPKYLVGTRPTTVQIKSGFRPEARVGVARPEEHVGVCRQRLAIYPRCTLLLGV